VAECNNAETGVGPSLHQVTKDVKILCRFGTAAKIKIWLLFNSGNEKEKS